jgi:hypothetical protein
MRSYNLSIIIKFLEVVRSRNPRSKIIWIIKSYDYMRILR